MSAHLSSDHAQLAFPDDAPPAFPAAIALQPPLLLPDLPALQSRRISLPLKRGLDIVGALAGLLITAPVLLLLALAVRRDGGPVLYGHRRIGANDRPFKCLKFRTMVVNADRMLADHLAASPLAAAEWAHHRKLTNDPRVTRIGAILRKTSLDELPQLINVLRGEMSLVGPRPVVSDELREHYGPTGRFVYSAMRPGITGLWQISGRSDTSYRERVTLDIAYGRNWSLLLDIKILVRTLPAVLTRRGAV
jgi:lipopolysaccharide/colanic/teichoic acid biosynthesis glycosyltransferase